MKKLFVAATVLAAISAPLHAASVVDQSNLATLPAGGSYTFLAAASNLPIGNHNLFDVRLAQSVTAGLSGKLTAVDLQLQALPNVQTGFQYTVTLAKNVVFNPDNSVASYSSLGAIDLPASALGLVDVDTSALGIQLNAGDMFWIALSVKDGDTGAFGWVNGTTTQDGNTTYLDYADGQGRAAAAVNVNSNTIFKYGTLEAFNGSHDFAFRTWMDTAAVPEPATWAMMIAGFAVAGGAMRRRSRTAISLA